MVLFENVNVGQRVDVNLGWLDVRGTVQYKGALAAKPGDWVGVRLEEKGEVVLVKFLQSEIEIVVNYLDGRKFNFKHVIGPIWNDIQNFNFKHVIAMVRF